MKALSSLPLSPPLLFSSSFLHFPVLVFGSSLLSLWYKARGWPQAAERRHTVSGELMKGDSMDSCYCANLRVCSTVLHVCPGCYFFILYSFDRKETLWIIFCSHTVTQCPLSQMEEILPQSVLCFIVMSPLPWLPLVSQEVSQNIAFSCDVYFSWYMVIHTVHSCKCICV